MGKGYWLSPCGFCSFSNTGNNAQSRAVKFVALLIEGMNFIEVSRRDAPSIGIRIIRSYPNSATPNLSAWKEVGIHLGHLDRLLQVLEVIQVEAISTPSTLTELLKQEILQLRGACSALLKRSLAPEDNSHDS